MSFDDFDDLDCDPPMCPLCDEEIGNSERCEHCKMHNAFAALQSKHNNFKADMLHAVRYLATCQLHADGNPAKGVSTELIDGLVMAMHKVGMAVPQKLVDATLERIDSNIGRYSERFDFNDEALSNRIWLERDRDAARRLGQVLPDQPLDCKMGASIWLYRLDEDESYIVLTEREYNRRANRDGRGVSGAGRGWTLRENLKSWFRSITHGYEFWTEFLKDYLVPITDAELAKPGGRITFVTDDFSAYTGYVGENYGSGVGVGFGGTPFLVQLKDGRSFRTNNLWSRGTVPLAFRSLIKPTGSRVESRPAITKELKL